MAAVAVEHSKRARRMSSTAVRPSIGNAVQAWSRAAAIARTANRKASTIPMGDDFGQLRMRTSCGAMFFDGHADADAAEQAAAHFQIPTIVIAAMEHVGPGGL